MEEDILSGISLPGCPVCRSRQFQVILSEMAKWQIVGCEGEFFPATLKPPYSYTDNKVSLYIQMTYKFKYTINGNLWYGMVLHKEKS